MNGESMKCQRRDRKIIHVNQQFSYDIHGFDLNQQNLHSNYIDELPSTKYAPTGVLQPR